MEGSPHGINWLLVNKHDHTRIDIGRESAYQYYNVLEIALS